VRERESLRKEKKKERGKGGRRSKKRFDSLRQIETSLASFHSPNMATTNTPTSGSSLSQFFTSHRRALLITAAAITVSTCGVLYYNSRLPPPSSPPPPTSSSSQKKKSSKKNKKTSTTTSPETDQGQSKESTTTEKKDDDGKFLTPLSLSLSFSDWALKRESFHSGELSPLKVGAGGRGG
jgi:hypothetical protein